MMRRTVRDSWVTALRSGEYAQTQGKLCALNSSGKPVGYCCLGVLSDLALKAGVPLGVVDQDGYRSFSRESQVLPEEVMEWASGGTHERLYSPFGGSWGSADISLGEHTAAEWNDGVIVEAAGADGKNFLEIADLIEKHVEIIGDEA